MWITNPNAPRPAGASLAQVSFAEQGQFGAVGELEYRQSPLFAPGGIHWRPVEGQRLLLLPCAGGVVCAGAQSSPEGLAPGELCLTAGGGYIKLCQNGDVCINDLRITREGQLIPPQQAGASV